MLKLSRKSLLIIFILLLTACHSITSSDNDGNDDKKVRAAKINTQLGMAYLERHDLQRAKHKLVLALDEAPNLPEAWYAMGYFMEMTGNQADAKRYYLKSVALAPNRGDTHNNYGTYLCRNGEYENAISHFMLAVKDPKYLGSAAAFENAGLCALKIPNAKRAQQFFNQALKEDPERQTSLIELAKLNIKEKNYALAKQNLDNFLKLSPPTEESLSIKQQLLA